MEILDNLLFSRVMFLVGGMLIFTAIGARINKAYETSFELTATFFAVVLLLILSFSYKDDYPTNLIILTMFSFSMGWNIGPAISRLGYMFKFKKYLKEIGVGRKVTKEKIEGLFGRSFDSGSKKIVFFYKNTPKEFLSQEQIDKIEDEFEQKIVKLDPYNREWQNVIFNAMFCTCLAVLSSAFLVYFSSVDFGFLGSILFLSLIIFIAVYMLNHFIFKSSTRRTMLSYVGAVIFCFYLVYDFSMLEKAMASGDNSWGKAVVIAVNIYLDIINLFLEILQALGGD